nr:hypothetical protein [Tanacetum cinerariifolium]
MPKTPLKSFETASFMKEDTSNLPSHLATTDDLPPYIKDWELIIRENVICIDTHKSSIDACSTIMLYHLKNSQNFNLGYFIAHKIKSVKNRFDCPLPYGLLITLLYGFILAKHPKIFHPYHPLQFALHYRMMSSINKKNERKRNEPESASAPLETATKSAGRSTTRSKSRQVSASESAFAEEPEQTLSLRWTNPLIRCLNRVDTLTPELLVGPTFELMKGSCTSLIEFEYHLEEVYKATTDQLDLVNPEGQQYPHNLLQPLSLIPDNRGRRVIPFAHFINNDLEYLRGGASSRKYTTSVTKTKASDYENIKLKDM